MRLAKAAGLLLVVMQLGGCSTLWDTSKKLGQVLWDPSTPVGVPGDQPTTITQSLVADQELNPNSSGDSTPVVFQVFQLEDDSKFLAADYDSLTNDFEEALGTNYIAHQDFTILPAQFKFIEALPLESGTRYMGVMAGYSNPEVSQWKKVLKVKPKGREYHVLVLFTEHEVVLDIVE